VLVVHSFNISGVLIQACIGTRALIAQGYDVIVVGRPGAYGQSVFDGLGAKTLACSDDVDLRDQPLLASRRDVRLVMCESLFADSLARKVMLVFPRAPRVLRVHEEVTDHQIDTNLWQYRLTRSVSEILADFNLLIFPSHHTCRLYTPFHNHPVARCVVVPNSVEENMRQSHAVPDDTFRILQLGTIGPRKNPLLTLQAFEQFRTHYNAYDSQLRFVGSRGANETEREYIRTLQEAVHASRLIDSVEVLPTRFPPETDLSWASVLTLHSSTECSPTALLEANFFGKKFIAPAVGGIPELVLSDVNGDLFPFGDIAAQARLFGTLYEQRQQLDARRAGIRAHYDSHFSSNLFRTRFAAALTELLNA
jgi:glycosyltransferase involved in cell wall biosynthesis